MAEEFKTVMKRNFRLTKGKHAPARVIDGIKADVRKYIKRERGKELPKDADFWDFECKVGQAAETAVSTHLSAIGKAIDEAAAASTTESIYVGIEVKGKRRNPPKPKPEKPEPEKTTPSIFDPPEQTTEPSPTSDSPQEAESADSDSSASAEQEKES